MDPMPLSNATLDQLPPGVARPSYDRATLEPGVVHFGVGAFHRAHQAVVLEELAEAGETSWGVVGVGLRSRSFLEALEPQDLLYTVVSRSAEHDEARVVGVLTRCLFAPDDPEAVLAALTDERARLVTTTVTAGGYEPEPDEQPGQPMSLVGYLVEGLARRRAAGRGPLTVLSCDNVEHNGRVARDAVLQWAERREDDLAEWIAAQVAFPSSMVDRITPGTSDALRDLLVETHGLEDRCPVAAEPYLQWVIEDAFATPRPRLEDAGAQIVEDVAPYELMKTRMLNGSHIALGFLGVLSGLQTTDEAMACRTLHRYLDRMLSEEVQPLLPPVPGVDFDAYRATLLERFANPRVADDLHRLCRRGSTKIPHYLLPSLKEATGRGTPRAGLVLALAAWFRYLRGVDLDGNPIPISDARHDVLKPLADEGGAAPEPLLEERELFDGLSEDDALAIALYTAGRLIDRHGPLEALEAYLDDQLPVAA